MKHVTVIDGDVSYPPTSGKRIRTLNLLLGLTDRFKITYIARSDGGDTQRADSYFRDHAITPIFVDAPLVKKQGPAFYARLLANMAERTPYSVVTHTHAAMREAVQRHAADARPDVWQLEWTGYDYCLDPGGSRNRVVSRGRFYRSLPRTPRALNWQA